MRERDFNFNNPAWKDPEDFLVPKPPEPHEWSILFKKMQGSGKEAKMARKRIEIAFYYDFVDLAVRLSNSEKQFEALQWKWKCALNEALGRFKGDPKNLCASVKAELEKAMRPLTQEEADAVLREKQVSQEGVTARKELEAALRQEMRDMAMQRARSYKSYLELLTKGEDALMRAFNSYKGDLDGLAAFVRRAVGENM